MTQAIQEHLIPSTPSGCGFYNRMIELLGELSYPPLSSAEIAAGKVPLNVCIDIAQMAMVYEQLAERKRIEFTGLLEGGYFTEPYLGVLQWLQNQASGQPELLALLSFD